MVLFTVLNKVVVTFASVGEILKCDHSNESKLLNSTFLRCCLLCLARLLTSEYVKEILQFDHSNESNRIVLSSGAV